MIKVENLHFTYPGRREETIRGMDFDIEPGEIFGFLGPSGAGKSTTQKILTGILKDYRGRVQVLGRELAEIDTGFYEKIGVSFETPNLYTKFTGRENLDFARRLYRDSTVEPELLLKQVGLELDADRRVAEYSKGMRMRLNFCRALVNEPELLFLDEPTAGLDPVNAKTIKDIIRQQQRMGRTVFLTTHNMQVADELCDRVAFIVDGAIAAIGAPKELKIQAGSRKVLLEYRLNGSLRSETLPLDGLHEQPRFLELSRLGQIETIHSTEASLEDVFIRTTGRALI